jgi:hypothetical protein
MNITEMKQTLTQEEVKEFECLVRLGDSLELAYETVLNERLKEESKEFYRNAYEN